MIRACMRRAVVFDMDGTLVDSASLAVESARDGLRAYWSEHGREPVFPAETEIRAAVGLPSLDYFAALLPRERRAHAPALRALVTHSERRRLARGDGRLMPLALETLAHLRAAGWALAIVSNCGRGYLDANLDHLGLRAAVDLALCLDDAPSKPKNVADALRRLHADRGAMVGDRAGDIEAGRAAGLLTVACRYGFGAPDELRDADHAIDGLRELPALLARLD
jgi:phosphoglycolate phosphatase-like HAD superfamily hydrolase